MGQGSNDDYRIVVKRPFLAQDAWGLIHARRILKDMLNAV